MSKDTFGCHSYWERCSWHLGGGGRGCCAQDSSQCPGVDAPRPRSPPPLPQGWPGPGAPLRRDRPLQILELGRHGEHGRFSEEEVSWGPRAVGRLAWPQLTRPAPLSSCSCGKSWSGGGPGSCMSTRKTWCGRCGTRSRSASRRRWPACCWSPSGTSTRMWPRWAGGAGPGAGPPPRAPHLTSCPAAP